METFVEQNELLPDSQNGFRKGRSTTDSIFILDSCCRAAFQRHQHLYAAFIDFTTAFDIVNRGRIYKKIRQLNVPEYHIRAVEEIYRSTPYKIHKIISSGLPED